jgi:hypothetical protein
MQQPGLRDWVSGKFVLQVTETIDRDKALSVVIELVPGVAGNETPWLTRQSAANPSPPAASRKAG